MLFRSWYPKAQQVQKLSVELYSYIAELKNKIITEAGGNPNDPTKTFKEDNLDVVTRLMVKNGGGNELKKKLEDYSKAIRAIDHAIDSTFKEPFVDLSDPPGADKKKKEWDKENFLGKKWFG